MAVIRFIKENKKWIILGVIAHVVVLNFILKRHWDISVIVGGVISPATRTDGIVSMQQKQPQANSVGKGFFSGLWNLNDHIEDTQLGHTIEVFANDDHHPVTPSDERSRSNKTKEVVIAIGGGITSRRVSKVDASSNFNAKFQFFNTFLPTFCKTASANFTYRFYLAYDFNDPVFANPQIVPRFQRAFLERTRTLCFSPRGIKTSLHLVKCSHAGTPARAQNDAMLEAYLDHVDYYYRINDDTRMLTGGWATDFIRTLDGYHPPRVGVVGPNHHGGNTGILTYDFVHRTHVDIFGFYYPRVFTDWWGDTWMTTVYRPGRSTKLKHIRLAHTLKLGQRYKTHYNVGSKLPGQREHDKKILNRYVAAVRDRNVAGVLSTKSDGRRIIAMSLYGRHPRHTWGVLRNAQLVPVHFPGWRLRVYVPPATNVSADLAVPQRFIEKLRLLRADIAIVNNVKVLPPREWRLLVANDLNVDFFLIRDAESRLSDRDASAVNEWIAEVEKRAKGGDPDAYPVHCIRDHPKHAKRVVVDGLWGGRPAALRHRLGTSLTTALRQNLAFRQNKDLGTVVNVTGSAGDRAVSLRQQTSALEEILWPILAGDGATVLCHDVMSPCDSWETMLQTKKTGAMRRPFPVARQDGEYVGQRYNEHQEVASGDDSNKLLLDVRCPGVVDSISIASLPPQKRSVKH